MKSIDSHDGAIPVERGCGRRTQGGIYWETGLSQNGLPLEHFLCDPPAPIDPADFGLSPIGTRLILRDGTYHVLDRIGTSDYPNVADMVEEIRRFGLSRRITRNLEFAKIDATRSRILLVHDRAWIDNATEYHIPADGTARTSCPKAIDHHPQDVACCAGVWYDDIHDQPTAPGRSVKRTMPSFEYWGRCPPTDVTPRYRPAIFASLPLTRFAVIHDATGTHETTADNLREAGHNPAIVPE